ncbi:glycosyltransferase [uncultured Rikenella sp.]|uniref:glycosyltransferase n=1 Tax=uncultured Rikenella sp. TaxID=368003 RepID=UPI00260F2C5F|nr:glycosyltransferase [uncultured Rikenella sp.]
MKEFIDQYPPYQIYLTLLLALCAIVQLVYWLRYGRVATHRHSLREPEGAGTPPVSVVVVVADDPEYVTEHLPKLLTQKHPNYEVVVVDDGSKIDLTDELVMMQAQYPHLRFTTIKADPVFRHSKKLALTVGIKAARYDNIIFTDADSIPSSDKWLSIMARGFNGGQLVVGYTGIQRRPGIANKIMRCQRLTTSIRYLNAAIRGHVYRGIYNNIGYTKRLFFGNKGYTHLRMTLGEDDLFVQKVAPVCARRTSVMLNPGATMRQFQWGGIRWWRAEQRYRGAGFDLYPGRVRATVFFELLTRALLIAATIALGVLLPPVLWIAGIGLFALRELAMLATVRMIARRVGERRILWAYIAHDFCAPVGELFHWIGRRLRPSQRLWI